MIIKSISRYRIVIISLMLIFPIFAFAEPSIDGVSGTSTHDGVVTISGSGFGTKIPAKPLVWETHETGSLSADWGTSMNIRDMQVSTAEAIDRHANSNYYGYDSYDMYSAYRYDTSYSNTWYISFWFRLGSDWVYHNGGYLGGLPDNYMSNIKTTLLWNYNVECTLSTCGYPAKTGTWHCGPKGNYRQYATTDSQETIWPNKETWYSQQIVFKDSTTKSSGDGIFEAWANGKRYLSDHSANLYGGGNTFVLDAGWIDAWHNPCPVSYCANIYYDDIYIDNTLARVIVCDSSDFTNCTHQEIQIPSAWSSNSITITVNQGSFSNCETVYLFVVDADGNVNTAGYPIRIVTGAGEAPCPPAGLKIQ